MATLHPHPRILVVGGSGFIGRHLVPRLASLPRHVIVPTRDRERMRHLAVQPNCELVQADIHDDATLGRLLEGCDAVVNLVGILHDGRGDPYGAGFARAHVELPRRLARAAAGAGVRRLVHVSALGVRDDGTRAPSMYLRSKTDGERAVREGGVPWTILRPSVVFGPDDAFLNLFARLARVAPVLAVGRADARFAPVYVGDVAQAIVNALDLPGAAHRVYELAGPETFTLAELVRLAARLSGSPRPVIGLPDALGRLQAAVLEFAPGPTLMSRDNFDSMAVPNLPSDPALVFPPELGIEPQALTALAPAWLSRRSPLSELRARARR